MRKTLPGPDRVGVNKPFNIIWTEKPEYEFSEGLADEIVQSLKLCGIAAQCVPAGRGYG